MGKFKAIIVGGSIAGQALALAFEKGNIDYVLLEARSEMAPDLGASVGLFPSGLRILDQLGLLEKISATTVPMETGFYRQKHNGKVFCQSTMLQELTKRYVYLERFVAHFTQLNLSLLSRHGYNFTFFERQKLLSIMYDAQSDKSKLLINKTIISIDEDNSGVKVTTKDGSVYEGDVVIGADGVWSTVREHMWKQMEKAEQPPAELQEDRSGMIESVSITVS
jgi:2-polyprenyl-6-methoxyphenol hydroxylase-like FAD-dependent oxidoreductase